MVQRAGRLESTGAGNRLIENSIALDRRGEHRLASAGDLVAAARRTLLALGGCVFLPRRAEQPFTIEPA
jgi:hypothetical protein